MRQNEIDREEAPTFLYNLLKLLSNRDDKNL
jgi:hypothetical protein